MKHRNEQFDRARLYWMHPAILRSIWNYRLTMNSYDMPFVNTLIGMLNVCIFILPQAHGDLCIVNKSVLFRISFQMGRNGTVPFNMACHWWQYAPFADCQTIWHYICPMLFQCWSTVFDAAPTLKQHWLNAPCLLGDTRPPVWHTPDFSLSIYHSGPEMSCHNHAWGGISWGLADKIMCQLKRETALNEKWPVAWEVCLDVNNFLYYL